MVGAMHRRDIRNRRRVDRREERYKYNFHVAMDVVDF